MTSRIILFLIFFNLISPVRSQHFLWDDKRDSTFQLLDTTSSGWDKVSAGKSASNYLQEPERQRNFWRASSEWFLAQAIPASFNRFITKDPYSYISFGNFIDHQRLSAWDWDDNQFTTNQIDHPYHGQLYFNAFRSNGYNFYQSSLATLAGSYIWETAGETQHPSINDLINTSFGGVILGE